MGQRIYYGNVCGYTTNRDVAAAQVVCQRGLVAMQRVLGRGFQGAEPASAHSPLAFPHKRLHQDAVGQSVNQVASGGVLSGTFLDV